MPPAALSRLLQTLSGREHPPGRADAARLARDLRPATLHGVWLLRAGRFGPGLIACREPAALAPSIPAIPGAIWDNRFRLVARALPPSWRFGALGPRRRAVTNLPAAVLLSLPAVYDADGVLRSAPLADLHNAAHEIDVMFAPALPIAPSFFMCACHPDAMTDDRLSCPSLAP